MADRIIFEQPDGSIVHRVPALGSRKAGEDLDAFVARTAVKELQRRPAGTRRLPGHIKLPTRRFRGCWRCVGDEVQVDMPLARAQRMGEIRAERNGKLSAADGPTARESEQNGPQKAAWFAYKQALRDLPASLDLNPLATAAELEAFEPRWPKQPGA